MIFINEKNIVQKESLRVYVLGQLEKNKNLLSSLLDNSFWQDLHNSIGSLDEGGLKERSRKAESQAISLPSFIESYVKTALDSPERFDLFVKIKASELEGDDQEYNYFWALQIRHDQVLALVRAIEDVVGVVLELVKKSPNEALNNNDFLSLAESSIEDRVYVEAEKVYKERNKSSE
ncbi:hypothetical protein ACFL1M_03995 [Patescibacteria group bacterium]